MIIITSLFLFSTLSFSLEKNDPTLKILIIGDSITEGYGVSKEDSYPSQLEKILRKKRANIQVVNAGSSGSTSASAINRLRWHLKSQPKILIIALGANDGLRGTPVESTKENLKKSILLAQEKKIKVYLAGMKLPMNYGEKYRQDFEKIFTDLSRETKITVIPFLLKDVGGVKELNLADGIHPNEKGHKIIAQTVADVIGPQL